MDQKIRTKRLQLACKHRNMTVAGLRADSWPRATTVDYGNEAVVDREGGSMRRLRKLASLILLPTVAFAGIFAPMLAARHAAVASSALEERQDATECQEVPGCQTVMTPVQNLRQGQPVLAEFTCPTGTYFWNWSATVAPYVVVALRGTRLDENSHELAARFIFYAQTGNGRGRAQVYLACSDTPISTATIKLRRWGHGWNPHE